MITGIAIENFKGIGDRVELTLRPITLLFGANSAGKSTILHAFQYAAEIFERRNIDAHSLGKTADGVDLGGFHNFVHGKRSDQLVTVALSVSLPPEGLPDFNTRTLPELDEPDTVYNRPNSTTVSVSVGWSELLGRAYVARYAVEIDGDPFASIEYEAGTLVSEMSLNENHQCLVSDNEHSWLGKWHPLEADQLEELDGKVLGHLLSWASENFVINGIGPGQEPYTTVLGIVGQKDALPDFSRRLKFDADWDWSERDPQLQTAQLPELSGHITELLSQMIVGPGQLVRKYLMNSRFLGPIREVPARTRLSTREESQSCWSTGLSAWDCLESGNEQLVSDVNYWLSDESRLNSGIELTVKNYKEIDLSNPLMAKLVTGRAFDEVEDDAQLDISGLPTYTRLVITPVGSSLELTPRDVGIGISQLVPVVVSAVDGKGRFVSIEQPELHVHPKLQADVAELFIEGINANAHQFIIETHSEHLILRLLRRIRETTDEELRIGHPGLVPNRLSVVFLEQSDTGVVVHPLRVDESGEFLDRWPRGFFEERAQELF
ncbi:MAG TPA: hypothetical protein DDW52_02810 [Planctomycetaceae bacterium]|nr:hypothetical protein [Planctomycetaceae bacterium]